LQVPDGIQVYKGSIVKAVGKPKAFTIVYYSTSGGIACIERAKKWVSITGRISNPPDYQPKKTIYGLWTKNGEPVTIEEFQSHEFWKMNYKTIK
jgi:hypothetical protein